MDRPDRRGRMIVAARPAARIGLSEGRIPSVDREAMNDRPTIIEAAATPEQARRVYDLWSHFYGWWAPLFERRPQMPAVEQVAIQPHDRVRCRRRESETRRKMRPAGPGFRRVRSHSARTTCGDVQDKPEAASLIFSRDRPNASARAGAGQGSLTLPTIWRPAIRLSGRARPIGSPAR